VNSSAVENAAAVVGGLRAPFRACYNANLLRDRQAVGRVKVGINVGADGVPWRATARATGFLDAAAVHCVLDVALKARFGATTAPKTVIQVPITFVRNE
jgi:hypothetical protein